MLLCFLFFQPVFFSHLFSSKIFFLRTHGRYGCMCHYAHQRSSQSCTCTPAPNCTLSHSFFFVAAVEHRTRFYRFRKVERRDISLTHTHWLKYARTNARIRPAGPFCLHGSNKSLCTGEKIAAALHSTCTAAFSTRMSRTRIESASTSKLQANRPTSNTTQNSGGGETVRSKHRVHRLSVRLR